MQILEGLSTLVYNFSMQYDGDLPGRMIQAIFYAIQFIDYAISYCQERRELLQAVDINVFKQILDTREIINQHQIYKVWTEALISIQVIRNNTTVGAFGFPLKKVIRYLSSIKRVPR